MTLARSFILWLAACASTTTAHAADPMARVELEIATSRSSPITGSQKWLAFLSQMDFQKLRFYSSAIRVRPSTKMRHSGGAVTYAVTGVLNSRNQLELPGESFRIGDRTGLNRWKAQLIRGQAATAKPEPTVFGLTPVELSTIRQALAARVTTETKNQEVFSSVRSIIGELRIPVVVDSIVRQKLDTKKYIVDELRGLSTGTGVAAALKQLGLGFTPELDSNGKLRIKIASLDRGAEAWPVGWPPEEKIPRLLPKLFEKLDVEINDTPLSDTLDALQQRIDVPFILDHGNLVLHKIDPTGHLVQFPAKRTYYKYVIDRVCSKAKLRMIIRVDDGDEPFLWFTTRNR